MSFSMKPSTDKTLPKSKPKKKFIATEEQEAGKELALSSDMMKINAISGSGKEQPITSLVQTPEGERMIGDLTVGDYVIGQDGKPTKVLGVYPQGVKDVYEVTFRDHTKVRCGIDHLWSVKKIGWRTGYKTLSLQDIIQDGVISKFGAMNFQVPLCAPVTYSYRKHILSPYLIGILLGDGYLCGTVMALSYHEDDVFIIDKVKYSLPGGCGWATRRHTSPKGIQCNIIKTDKTYLHNPVKMEIINLGLNVKGNDKFIPEEYLYDSIENRVELLRGLMDTDGSCTKNRTSFSSCSLGLVKGITKLVQSLGGITVINEYKREGKNKEYHVNVKINTFCPFSLPRKAANWRPSLKNPPSKYISDISKLEVKEDQVCIKVEAEDSLYLTDNYTVTHNTSELVYISDALPVRSLYMAFNKAMADEAATKFSSHVECMTTHSLAYRNVGKKYHHKLSRPKGRYVNVALTGAEIARYFKLPDFDLSEDTYISKTFTGLIVRDTVNRFEYSASDEIQDLHIPFNHMKYLGDTHGKDFPEKKYRKLVLRYAIKLWEERTDTFSEVCCTHNTYLKLYQLSSPDLSEYKVIYLDEAQDGNAVTLDIIMRQKDKCKLIFVGDKFQQIYSWNGSVNTMQNLNCPKAVLTKSFRFGEDLARVATAILRNDVKITGNENIDTAVGDQNVLDYDKPYTIIYRSNMELLFSAVELLSKGDKINVNIDLRDFVAMIKSAEALIEGDLKKVKHENIIPFNNWDEMKEEGKEDRELGRIVKIVEGGDSQEMIDVLHSYHSTGDELITLTTAHKSKGLEFQQVRLAEDFPSNYTKDGKFVGLSDEESNLLYVSATRAIVALEYNETVQECIDRYDKVQPKAPVVVKTGDKDGGEHSAQAVAESLDMEAVRDEYRNCTMTKEDALENGMIDHQGYSTGLAQLPRGALDRDVNFVLGGMIIEEEAQGNPIAYGNEIDDRPSFIFTKGILK